MEAEANTSVRIILSEDSIRDFMRRSGVYVWTDTDPYEMVWRIQSRGKVGSTKTFILVPWDTGVETTPIQ